MNKSLPLANPAEFAKWLRDTRMTRGLTQGKLSIESGISTRTIVALENANSPALKTNVLLRLGHALDIQPETMASLAGLAHEKIVKSWILRGDISRHLSPDKRTWGNDWDDRVLTKEDLQFLMDMREQFDNFTLRFALDLLYRRKP